MDLNYYVYVLMDSSKPGCYTYGDYKFDYEPFYIGKGKLKRIKDTLYDKSPFKRNKISKLKRNNIEIISLKILESLTNELAIHFEILLISLIGRRDLEKGTLVNMTDGGDGRINSKHSDLVKYKISQNRIGKGIGWKHKPETLLKMSLNQSGSGNGFHGMTHSELTKSIQSKRVSGLSHPMYDRKHDINTIEILKKHRHENISNSVIKKSCQKFNKVVLMFDLDLNFISEFESVKQASLETGINHSVISKCCRGLIKSPTRYYFSYKNPEDLIKMNRFIIKIGDEFQFKGLTYKLIKRNKKTCICELNGELITIHKNDFNLLFEKETF